MSLPELDSAVFVDGDFDWLSLFPTDPLPPAQNPPCESASTSSQGAKRRRNSFEEGQSLVEPVSGRKRQRVELNFSCPYRRRHPQIFNVRDFPTCAQKSFSSITLVKRHVMSAHQANKFGFQCETCSVWFRTKKALNSHTDNETCSSTLPIADEYDKGITEDVENKLRDRRSETKVLNWDDLWRTIFPGSQDIISPGMALFQGLPRY
ncbi:hypothetical protein CEP51_014338 [Fusarium floridanum]|uniref:C2H2-type domain-containing protein n=1 Tax=Fusarium floridanum TaxID=1325733 RepID=A0A428PV08_9HYPO|nr:hypothetical protein CEP51_014338 [Fusarium floridanum]